jgi:serine protease Do
MSTAVQEIESTIGEVVERVGPAVVGIGRGWHPASGVIVGEGRILTNAHAIRREEVTVTAHDGRRLHAEVSGIDEDLDLVALRADTAGLPAVEWAPAESEVSIGRSVLALANPGGRGLRATLGFVSAYDRSFRGPRGRRIRGCIEHTAPLPRGSSGGPLVDASGRLLGLNAVRMSGLILAIPADEALEARANALMSGESTAPARLGVAVAPAHVGRRLRRAVGLPEEDGVLVRAVEAASAAERADLRRGDLIVAAQGNRIEEVDALYEALDGATRAGALELEVLRGTERASITVRWSDAKSEVEQ